MENNEIELISMQMILNAGDARLLIKEALDLVMESKFSESETKLEEAQDKIKIAHQAQTSLIQGEAAGVKQEYSMLFAHAQDTFMTIYSELHMARKLKSMFEIVDKRISTLEDNRNE